MNDSLMVLAILILLTGCASSLPTCDGKDRRPINGVASDEVFHASCGVPSLGAVHGR